MSVYNKTVIHYFCKVAYLKDFKHDTSFALELLKGNSFGALSSWQFTYNLWEKRLEENLLHMENAKQLTLMVNGKGQPENVKNGSKIILLPFFTFSTIIVVMWSIFRFAIHNIIFGQEKFQGDFSKIQYIVINFSGDGFNPKMISAMTTY